MFDPRSPERASNEELAEYLVENQKTRKLPHRVAEEIVRRTEWVLEHFDSGTEARRVALQKSRRKIIMRGIFCFDDLPRCEVCGEKPARPNKRDGELTLPCSDECITTRATKRRQDTMMERYGVAQSMQSGEIRNKAADTMMERYGVENPMKSPEFVEKARKTTIERYGVDHYSKTSEYADRVRNTNFERYGVEFAMQSGELVDRYNATIQKKYNTNWTFESNEIRDKIVDTVLDRYGVENPMQHPEIVRKSKQTMFDRYGDIYQRTGECRKKTAETNLERYGVEHPMLSGEVRKKLRTTNIEKYGVPCSLQSETVKKKITETNRMRYGVASTSQKHLVGETMDILNDSARMSELYSTVGVSEMAMMLGCHPTTVYSYLGGHGIETDLWRETSAGENSLFSALVEKYPDAEQSNNTIIGPKEIDIFIPSANVGLEYNGVYWHSTEKNTPTHLVEKTREAEDVGVHIIHVFEDEWNMDRGSILRKIFNIISGGDCSFEENEVILDRRMDDPRPYLSAGYEVVEEVPPDFWYVKNNIRVKNGDESLPKIYDCGKLILRKKRE